VFLGSVNYGKYGGFHSHGGTPIAGCFISWKSPSFSMDDARDTTYGNPLEMVNLSRNGFISPSEIPGWQNLVTYMGKIWEIYGDLWEIVSGSASHSELEAMDHRNRLFTY